MCSQSFSMDLGYQEPLSEFGVYLDHGMYHGVGAYSMFVDALQWHPSKQIGGSGILNVTIGIEMRGGPMVSHCLVCYALLRWHNYSLLR